MLSTAITECTSNGSRLWVCAALSTILVDFSTASASFRARNQYASPKQLRRRRSSFCSGWTVAGRQAEAALERPPYQRPDFGSVRTTDLMRCTSVRAASTGWNRKVPGYQQTKPHPPVFWIITANHWRSKRCLATPASSHANILSCGAPDSSWRREKQPHGAGQGICSAIGGDPADCARTRGWSSKPPEPPRSSGNSPKDTEGLAIPVVADSARCRPNGWHRRRSFDRRVPIGT